MSYCRWSSDNFACDIYAYEDVMGGYTIHLAGRRHVGLPDDPAPIGLLMDADTEEKRAEWLRLHNEHMKVIEKHGLVPIDHPLAGTTENVDTLAELHARLLELRAEGFVFGDWVLENIAEEMAAASS